MLAIVGGLLLSVGDRYVIRILLDERAVGLYAVGYGVATALGMLVIRPLNLFAFPAYTKVWDFQGSRDTSALLGRIMEGYLMIYLPLVAVAWMWGGEALVLLVGIQYAEAVPVVAIVFSALLFQGAATVTVAGLYLQNQTATVGWLTVGVALLNLAANGIVVPRMGILGAALVTLGTYLVHFAAVSALALRRVRVQLALRRVGRTLLACSVSAGLGFGLERWVGLPFPAALGAGIITYGALLLGIDAEMRRAARSMLHWLERVPAAPGAGRRE